MNPPFQPWQQPPSSNSCLPTCVRAVLSWHGKKFSADQVSEWCREEADGCAYFVALQSLRDEDFDIEEVDDEETLLGNFAQDEPEPVIVMIRTPAMPPNSDHAVVIHAIHQQNGAVNMIEYMDPAAGANHQDSAGLMPRWWDSNGSRAFIIRPA